jgi:endogenous inhibitor of DNA gyrase (YacG/DUF329 family)
MSSAKVIPLRPARPCPICGRPSTLESRPFCSPRCADIDLNRWLSDAYVIPGDPATDETQEGIPGGSDGDGEAS